MAHPEYYTAFGVILIKNMIKKEIIQWPQYVMCTSVVVYAFDHIVAPSPSNKPANSTPAISSVIFQSCKFSYPLCDNSSMLSPTRYPLRHDATMHHGVSERANTRET